MAETWQHHRAKIAALSRDRRPTDPDLIAARRDLREIRLAEHIVKVVAQAPPLTDEQRARLSVLLKPGVAEQSRAGGPDADA